jgi:hypothetical protein
MQVGEIYIHKNTSERVRIRSLNDNVCTAEFIDRPKIWNSLHQEMRFEYCIARVDNLIPEVPDNQLNLFK